MRGTPFLQAVLIFVAFLLAGVPTYRLTRPAAAVTTSASEPTPAADRTPAKSAPLAVEAVFAPAPTDFEITNLGQSVLAGRGPQARFVGNWTTALPPEGADLVLQAHWPAGTGAGAMRVNVRFPSGRAVEKTFWADATGALDDVFTVPGETAPAATH